MLAACSSDATPNSKGARFLDDYFSGMGWISPPIPDDEAAHGGSKPEGRQFMPTAISVRALRRAKFASAAQPNMKPPPS